MSIPVFLSSRAVSPSMSSSRYGSSMLTADVSGRSSSAQMKWASKIRARYVVFVPSDPEGYAVRDMEAGQDLGKIRTAEAIRERLLGRAAVAGRTP